MDLVVAPGATIFTPGDGRMIVVPGATSPFAVDFDGAPWLEGSRLFDVPADADPGVAAVVQAGHAAPVETGARYVRGARLAGGTPVYFGPDTDADLVDDWQAKGVIACSDVTRHPFTLDRASAQTGDGLGATPTPTTDAVVVVGDSFGAVALTATVLQTRPRVLLPVVLQGHGISLGPLVVADDHGPCLECCAARERESLTRQLQDSEIVQAGQLAHAGIPVARSRWALLGEVVASMEPDIMCGRLGRSIRGMFQVLRLNFLTWQTWTTVVGPVTSCPQCRYRAGTVLRLPRKTRRPDVPAAAGDQVTPQVPRYTGV